jgi:hypothetical protein
MSPIIEQLQEMRKRGVVLYVGENSVTKLAAFLRGYEHAISKLRPNIDDNFLREFHSVVRERFAVSVSRSWEDIIAFHCASNDEAMKCFWELFDKYLAQ